MESEMDWEFKKVINEIKPLAKSLPRDSNNRHYVALWIKKLLSEESDKECRNYYSRLLLKSLQQPQLSAPFIYTPPSEPLTIPTDELLGHVTQSTSGIYSSYNSPSPGNGVRHSTPYTCTNKHSSVTRPSSVSPKHNSARRALKFDSLSSSSTSSLSEIKNRPNRIRTNSLNICLASSSSSDSEVSSGDSLRKSHKSKLLADMNYTKPVSLCSLSDIVKKNRSSSLDNETVKKLLRQKNNEIEQLQKEHLIECHKLNLKCQKLEKKVAQLESQRDESRRECDKEIKHTLKVSQQQQINERAKIENKFNAVINDMEQQKHNCEQIHSQQLQCVIDDANKKMLKMESDYETKIQSHVQQIHDLNTKVQQSNQRFEAANKIKEELIKEKNLLQHKHSMLESDIKLMLQKNEHLKDQCNNKDNSFQQMEVKLQQTIDDLNHQLSTERANSSIQISQLQGQLVKSETKLDETNTIYQKKITDIEEKAMNKLCNLKKEHVKQIDQLNCTIKQKESQLNQKISQLEASLREKEVMVKKIVNKYDAQVKISEDAVDKYKEKVEIQMDQMFGEMRTEIEKLENELAEAKRLRQQQEENYQKRTLEEGRRTMEKHSLEISHMIREHQMELHKQSETFQLEEQRLTDSCNQLKNELSSNVEKLTQQKLVISNLEQTIQNLNMKMEAERKESNQLHEAQIKQLKDQISIRENQLIEKHKKECSILSEKHGIQLKQIKYDQDVREALSGENIISLESKINSLKEDYERKCVAHQNEINELKMRNEDELTDCKMQQETSEKILNAKIEHERTTTKELEEKIQQQQMDYEAQLKTRQAENITLTKIQQESENTIQFLRSQVKLLTQRIELLQKQLDQFRTCSKLRKYLHQM